MDMWVVPYLGGVRLRDLGQARACDWRGQVRADGCSPHMSNQALSILSAGLGAAVRDGLLPSNPCSGVKEVPHVATRPNALTPEEGERIRVKMPTLRDVVMVGLLAHAGLRPEEVLALR
jgi:integrase